MSVAAVTLMLSDEKKELLFEILEERHRALLREIWLTDHRDFKLSLQKKERVLDSLLNRFTALTGNHANAPKSGSES